MSDPGQAMRLQTFPSDDSAFRDAVIKTFGSDRSWLPDAFEEALRAAYPRVRVAARARAASGPEDRGLVWYVFRDGAVISDPPSVSSG